MRRARQKQAIWGSCSAMADPDSTRPRANDRRGGDRAVQALHDGEGGGPADAGQDRIRWSKADSAAFDPSPIAMTICLYGTVVTSPAAKMPGWLVAPRASTSISPRSLRDRKSVV